MLVFVPLMFAVYRLIIGADDKSNWLEGVLLFMSAPRWTWALNGRRKPSWIIPR
jgi:hypothetical protein